MNEMLFEYHYDPTRKQCCLNCNYYFKHMKIWDVQQVMDVNKISERKEGQKLCIKKKVFVYLSDSYGYFFNWPVSTAPKIEQKPF